LGFFGGGVKGGKGREGKIKNDLMRERLGLGELGQLDPSSPVRQSIAPVYQSDFDDRYESCFITTS
jgi:hypothetical protein